MSVAEWSAADLFTLLAPIFEGSLEGRAFALEPISDWSDQIEIAPSEVARLGSSLLRNEKLTTKN
jgi:hypothetical protein